MPFWDQVGAPCKTRLIRNVKLQPNEDICANRLVLVYSLISNKVDEKMQYDISFTQDIACITVEGNLNSLDLMFMFQSKEYNEVVSEYKKLLIDYTSISGVSVTPEDAFAITMLGKMGLDNIGQIRIAVAVNELERDVMEKVTKNIFSDSQSEIIVTDTKTNALKILHSP